MSKSRARRRGEREAAAALERERRERAARRRARRTRLTTGLTAGLATRLPSGSAPRRPRSALATRRRRQDGVLLAALFAGHVALWLVTDRWAWRLGALVLTVLAWPVLVTVLYDRRPGQG